LDNNGPILLDLLTTLCSGQSGQHPAMFDLVANCPEAERQQRPTPPAFRAAKMAKEFLRRSECETLQLIHGGPRVWLGCDLSMSLPTGRTHGVSSKKITIVVGGFAGSPRLGLNRRDAEGVLIDRYI